MLRIGLAGLALAAGMLAAAAQEMKSPRILPSQVAWDAMTAELTAIEALKPAAAPELLAELNRATGERFANIAASPVPVPLPFDTAAFLRDRAAASVFSARFRSRCRRFSASLSRTVAAQRRTSCAN